jgi:hypothetical protein
LKNNGEPKKLQSWGLKATWVYLVVFWGGLPVAAYFGIVKLNPLTLNEIGDFLAGAFGPLAIFWLVLGFFQQGKELQNSVDALKLQAKELKNSVEQQKAMVGVTEKQLELDVKVRDEQNKLMISKELPYVQIASRGFSSLGGQSKGKNFKYFVKNIGAEASEVSVSLNHDDINLSPKEVGYIEKTTGFKLELHTSTGPNFPIDKHYKIKCVAKNLRGQTRTQIFSIGNFQPKEISCDPPLA